MPRIKRGSATIKPKRYQDKDVDELGEDHGLMETEDSDDDILEEDEADSSSCESLEC